jgi:menaquinone reductase, multiheme cytochrome c subunit
MKQLFPKYSDILLRAGIVAIALSVFTGIGLYAYLSHPDVMDTGYRPKQPIPYSHKLHAGTLAMDCYYCHSSVMKAGHAAVPPAETCMNCHTRVKSASPLLAPVREAYVNDTSVPWVRIHKLPDYAYFNHQAHVVSGVSCVSCHGRVDQMIEVQQVKPLSMAWCLECHRNPAPHLRPAELVTKLDWQPDRAPEEIGREIIKAKNINPPQNCGACHR